MFARRLTVLAASFGMLLGLFAVLSLGAPAALAYQGCNTTSSASANPTVADANQPIDFTATFRDCNGNGLNNVKVTFGQSSGPAGCTATFSPTSATTDANGVAHTTVTLPAGCPCQYVLTATGAGVTLSTTVRENGCLPFTGAARPAATGGADQRLPVALVVFGAALLVLASVYLLRGRRDS